MDKIAQLHYECVMESFYSIDVTPAVEVNLGGIVKAIGEKVLSAIKFVIGRFKKLLQWIKSKAFRRKKVEQKQEEPSEKKQEEATPAQRQEPKSKQPEGYDTYMKRVERVFSDMASCNAKANTSLQGILREVDEYVKGQYKEELDPDMGGLEDAAESAKETGDIAGQLVDSLTADYKAFLYYDDEARQKRLELTLTNAMNVMIDMSNKVNRFYDSLKSSAVRVESDYFGRNKTFVYKTDDESRAHNSLQSVARAIISYLQHIVRDNNKCLALLGRVFSVAWGDVE